MRRYTALWEPPRFSSRFVYLIVHVTQSCAQSKARNFGLKQTKNTTAAAPVMPVHDPIFDDDNDEDYDLAHDLPVIEPKFSD